MSERTSPRLPELSAERQPVTLRNDQLVYLGEVALTPEGIQQFVDLFPLAHAHDGMGREQALQMYAPDNENRNKARLTQAETRATGGLEPRRIGAWTEAEGGQLVGAWMDGLVLRGDIEEEEPLERWQQSLRAVHARLPGVDATRPRPAHPSGMDGAYWVQEVAVHPEYRRLRLGTAMASAAIESIRAVPGHPLQSRPARVWIARTPTGELAHSHQLFTRLGFEASGKRPTYASLDNMAELKLKSLADAQLPESAWS